MTSSLRIWRPFTNALLDPAPLLVVAPKACTFIWQMGRIIDAISSWWVNLHGHANPGITLPSRNSLASSNK